MAERLSRPAVGSREPVHLTCPRCGWGITLKTRWLAVRHCPRCVARRHVTVRLSGSQAASSGDSATG